MGFLVNNLKVIILAGTLVICAFLVIRYFQKIKTFLLEVKAELGKVAWSTRQELMGSTMVVIVVTFLLSIYIGIIDVLLSQFLTVVFK